MNRKNSILLITSVIVSLAVLEIGLRTFTPYPVSWTSNKVQHEKLGYVMDSGLAGIDKSGFRNESLPSVDIATIGDSHTYGSNVTSEHSWPKVLGRMLNKNVYNFGVGGYGVLQYSRLLDMVFEKNPETVLLGLYLENDLSDVCRSAITNKYSRAQASRMGMDLSLCPEADARISARIRSFSVSQWLNTKIALYSILSDYYLRYAVQREIDHNDDADALIVNDVMQRTIIYHSNIMKRAAAMDLEKPHIAMAFGLLKNLLQKARIETQARKIRLGVVLLPSKSRVFYSYLKERGYKLPGEYEQLVANEDKLKQATVAFLTTIGVPSSDALADMEQAIRKYKMVYLDADDGHPLEAGYRMYAEAAAKLVARRQ